MSTIGARGLALLLGAMGAIDLLTARASDAGSLSSWWVSTWAFLPWGRWLFIAAASATLLTFALRPAMGIWRRRLTLAMFVFIVARCLVDAAIVSEALAHGSVRGSDLPLSLLFAGGMAWVLHATANPTRARRRNADTFSVLGAASMWAMAFALAQMVTFGSTDYRRRADAVVVFGARVYADGRPSLALADRVRTGAALVNAGHASQLIVSGGPGDGDTHETEAMRDLAIEAGVPADAITLDPNGVSTRATVDGTRSLLRTTSPRPRILAVSHGYHLPRIKLSYQQEDILAFTVPAKETRPLLKLPWFMTREALAFWAHALTVR